MLRRIFIGVICFAAHEVADANAFREELLERQVLSIGSTLDIGDESADDECSKPTNNPPANVFIFIEPWNCDEVGGLMTKPIQMLCKDTICAVKALDIATGTYSELFVVDKKWSKPQYTNINACAINPVDSILYCVVKLTDEKTYIVRIGNNGMAFIGQTGIGWNSGGFSDLEGSGDMEYLVFMSSVNKLVIIGTSGTSVSWEITVAGLEGTSNTAWGAGWNFKGQLYFARNDGLGVYNIDMASIDIKTKTGKVVRAGSSAITAVNDGMNCMNVGTPFPLVVAPLQPWTCNRAGQPPSQSKPTAWMMTEYIHMLCTRGSTCAIRDLSLTCVKAA